jgi:hypothetical protein
VAQEKKKKGRKTPKSLSFREYLKVRALPRDRKSDDDQTVGKPWYPPTGCAVCMFPRVFPPSVLPFIVFPPSEFAFKLASYGTEGTCVSVVGTLWYPGYVEGSFGS